MRKVFLTNMELEKTLPKTYVSNDFDISSEAYCYPITYLIENNVEDGDVVVAISIAVDEYDNSNYTVQNSFAFEQEVKKALALKSNVDIEFKSVMLDGELSPESFNKCFKNIIELTDDEDQIFMDLSFGHRIFSFSMFAACNYAAKASYDLNVDTVIYSSKSIKNNQSESVTNWNIYDCTSLFRLNELAAEARPGDRIALDELLNFIIEE